MNDEEFLRKVLENNQPTESQISSMLKLRDRVRKCISTEIGGNFSMFMAGSFKKRTMIKQYYDLDMFIIWPTGFRPLLHLYYNTRDALLSNWAIIENTRVGWRIPYTNEFHVDVIPTVADNNDSGYSYLYNSQTNTILRTSMSIHMNEIDKYDRRDVIMLLKLWKIRRKVPIKTFLLEIIVHLACFNVTRSSLSAQLDTTFSYLSQNIVNKEFFDPANRANIISDDLIMEEKYEIRDKAYEAFNRDYWGKIFKNIENEKNE